MKALSEIIKVAAELVTIQLSDFPEDHLKGVPKGTLKLIEQHNEKQRDWSSRLASAKRELDLELRREKAANVKLTEQRNRHAARNPNTGCDRNPVLRDQLFKKMDTEVQRAKEGVK